MRENYKIKTISLKSQNYEYVENLFHLYRFNTFTETLNFLFETIRQSADLNTRIEREIALRRSS